MNAVLRIRPKIARTFVLWGPSHQLYARGAMDLRCQIAFGQDEGRQARTQLLLCQKRLGARYVPGSTRLIQPHAWQTVTSTIEGARECERGDGPL